VYLATSAIIIYGVELIDRRLLLYLAVHNYPLRFNTKTRPRTANAVQVFYKKIEQECMRCFLLYAPPRSRLCWEIAPFPGKIFLHTFGEITRSRNHTAMVVLQATSAVKFVI
jgi:hypothetical protein